jgi:hypothetical protein
MLLRLLNLAAGARRAIAAVFSGGCAPRIDPGLACIVQRRFRLVDEARGFVFGGFVRATVGRRACCETGHFFALLRDPLGRGVTVPRTDWAEAASINIRQASQFDWWCWHPYVG